MINFQNFNIRRVLYFIVGIYSLYEAYSSGETLFYLIGLLLIMQAAFNVTCLAGGSCAVPTRRNISEQ